MAIRDHYRLFREKRDDFRTTLRRRGEPPHRTSSTSNDRDSIDMAPPTKVPIRPLWADIRDAIEERFDHLRRSLTSLRDVQESVLRDTLGSRAIELDRSMETLSSAITKDAREVSKMIRRVARVDGVSSREEASLRKAMTMELSMRHREFLKTFRASRKTFVERLVVVRRAGGGGGSYEEEDESDLSSLLGSTQKRTRVSSTSSTATLTRRDKDISRIARSIAELAEMFQEMNTIVVEQGTMLDRIDYNMDVVVEKTRKGVFQLEQAEEQQKSNRALKCIAILLCLIFFLIVVYAVKKS
eukprot:g5129.t1